MRSALCLVIALLILQAPIASVGAPAAVPHWVEHLGFHVASEPMSNLALRQAIASAIDRQAILEAARGRLPRGSTLLGVAGSWFVPGLPQHRPDVRIHPYDTSRAKVLLAEAGFPEGRGLPEIEVLVRTDLPHRQSATETLKTQLAAVGIRLKVTGLPTYAAFFARVNPGPGRAKQYQMAIFAWGLPEPTSDFLRRQFLQGGPENTYDYRNPEVTLLIADILRETDPVKRVQMLQEAEKLILTDAPVVPLFYYATPP